AARQLPLVRQRYAAERLPEDRRRGEPIPARTSRKDPGGVCQHDRKRQSRDDARAASIRRPGPARVLSTARARSDGRTLPIDRDLEQLAEHAEDPVDRLRIEMDELGLQLLDVLVLDLVQPLPAE